MTTIASRYLDTTVFAKAKLALGLGAMIVLVSSATTIARADDASSNQLSTSDIFKKAQEKYVNLKLSPG